MSHFRPNGVISAGDYCAWCGDGLYLTVHDREDRDKGICIGNLALVMALGRANPPHETFTKPHFFYGPMKHETIVRGKFVPYTVGEKVKYAHRYPHSLLAQDEIMTVKLIESGIFSTDVYTTAVSESGDVIHGYHWRFRKTR